MNVLLSLLIAENYMADSDEEDHDELLRAGIDPEKLGCMKKSERCRILSAAGLNPSDFDF